MRPALLSRTREGCAALAAMGAGLTWRLAPLGLPAFAFKYGGSVLWGAMVMLIVGACWPGPRGSRVGPVVAALGVTLAAELFRLVHAPALDAFRATLAGALLFGRVFSLWNVAAYWLGVALALPVHSRLGRAPANTQ